MRVAHGIGSLALIASAPLAAADVSLSANLTNSCVLTISSSGTMTASADGTTLSSENAGGSAARLTVNAVGNQPSIAFSAPTLSTSPGGWSANPALAIRYSSSGGASQGYTSTASSAPTGLIDSFTVHGRIASESGFAAGNYVLRTVATCSQ